MKYTGQIGRPFRVKYQEHLRDFKYNNNKSKFTQHLRDSKHPIATMDSIMDIVHITRKGRMMNAIECSHIYNETKANNQINDRLTVRENAIFEAIVQEDPFRGQATLSQRNN
jgi:ferritin-like metal-binding protein YciE